MGARRISSAVRADGRLPSAYFPGSRPPPASPQRSQRSPSPSEARHMSPDARADGRMPSAYFPGPHPYHLDQQPIGPEQEGQGRRPASPLRSQRSPSPSRALQREQLEDPRDRSPTDRLGKSPLTGKIIAPMYYAPDHDAANRAKLKADDIHRDVERRARMHTKALAEQSERKRWEAEGLVLHAHGSPDRMGKDKFGYVDSRHALGPVHGRTESPAHRFADRGIGVAPDSLFEARPLSPSPPQTRNAHQTDIMMYSSSAQREVPARFLERRGGWCYYKYQVNGQDRIKRVREENDQFSYSHLSTQY